MPQPHILIHKIRYMYMYYTYICIIVNIPIYIHIYMCIWFYIYLYSIWISLKHMQQKIIHVTCNYLSIIYKRQGQGCWVRRPSIPRMICLSAGSHNSSAGPHLRPWGHQGAPQSVVRSWKVQTLLLWENDGTIMRTSTILVLKLRGSYGSC